jgi:putative FmdB family regulatory protein
MPTYDFRCPAGHEFERFYRKISDAVAELPCPQCGEPAPRRVSGGAGLMFKGSGFYLTDYGKNAHRGGPASNTDGGGAGEGVKGEGSKTPETKPPGGGGTSDGGGATGKPSPGSSSGGAS